MELREKLIQVSATKDEDEIISFLKECKSQPAQLKETLTSFSKKQMEDMWDSVIETFSSTLTALAPSDETEVISATEKALEVIQCLVDMATASVSQKNIFTPSPLIRAMVLLHGVLPSLSDEEHGKLKNNIAQLLEDWWKKKLPRQESVIINAFVYILARSHDLEPKPVIADVKRIYALREVLTLVNLSDNANFFNNLLRCLHAKQYIKTNEGQKFLAYVLTLDSGFIEAAHTVIKNILLTRPRSWMEYYGKIYIKAWQGAKSPELEKIELHCIQDLMYKAVHAQKVLFSCLSDLLGYIHKMKQHNEVQDLLSRLYEPFLWRSLKVPSSTVRANAARLFFSVCPLQNSTLSTAENTELLQKQFDLFEVLLFDPSPEIRCLSVLGVFNIMAQYWETIPTETLRNLILRLIQDLLMDASSPSVRECVIKGLTCLLNNPLCFVFLKTILPKTQSSFHDPSERVRIAMLDLLLKVKGICTMKYWTIVPSKDLLARLVVDTQPVKRRIVRLIINSFIPLDASRSERMDRCEELIRSNRAAARYVFRYAPQYLSLEETVAYITTICRYILISISANNRDTTGASQVEEDTVTGLQEEIVLGLSEAMAILWMGIREQLQQSSKAVLKKDLEKKFSCALPEMMQSFAEPEIQYALIQLARELPPEFIPTISRTFLPKIRKLEETATREEYKYHVEALLSWGYGGRVLELVSDWLRPSLDPPPVEESEIDGKKSKKKKVGFKEPIQLKPKLALGILNFMMEYFPCRDILIKEHYDDCLYVAEILGQTQDKISDRLIGQGQITPDDQFLLSGFSLYCVMKSLLPTGAEESVRGLSGILTWINNNLPQWLEKLPGATDTTEVAEESDSQAHTLVFQLLKDLLGIVNDCLLVGHASPDVCSQVCHLCQTCLTADESLQLLSRILLCLYQSVEFLNYNESETQSSYHSNLIPGIIGQIFMSVASFVKRTKTTNHEHLSSAKNLLVEVVQSVTKATWINEAAVQESLAAIVATVISELNFYSAKDELNDDDKPATLSQFLLDVLMKKQALIRLFLQELADCLEEGIIADLHSLHGVVFFMQKIMDTNSYKHCQGELKEVWRQTHLQIEKLTPDNNSSQSQLDLFQMTNEKLNKCASFLRPSAS